jgi:cholesterol oxidase
MAETKDLGVTDSTGAVHGYEGLYCIDSSIIPTSLGVNPSLTIAAQAERAFSLWPNKGEPDGRPEQGKSYQRVAPVAPLKPAVPETAPGALRLPIVEIKSPTQGHPVR